MEVWGCEEQRRRQGGGGGGGGGREGGGAGRQEDRRRCREGERSINTAVSVKHLRFLVSSPLPRRLSSRTRGRNYVWRARTSPPRRRPRPMRYVTGPSPPSPTVVIIISSSLPFRPPRPAASPHVCLQRRPVQVSLTSASGGEDEEEVLSALIVLGPRLIATNPPSRHACSAPRCFILRRDTC